MRKTNDTSKFTTPEGNGTLADRELDAVTGGSVTVNFSKIQFTNQTAPPTEPAPAKPSMAGDVAGHQVGDQSARLTLSGLDVLPQSEWLAELGECPAQQACVSQGLPGPVRLRDGPAAIRNIDIPRRRYCDRRAQHLTEWKGAPGTDGCTERPRAPGQPQLGQDWPLSDSITSIR
jgi:hypothetical protein